MQIVLGVSGSIAAYKAPELVRLLGKADISVVPVLTNSARAFVSPLSLETVAGHAVLGPEAISHSGQIQHLEAIKNIQAFVIAPASANTIARLASGFADDLICAMALSYSGPKLIVPAMHDEMWKNPITQKNIETLRLAGYNILGPDAGDLACGDYGIGRMVELPLIVLQVQLLLQKLQLHLNGKRILITCGGTQEAIDPVRMISNHSTGFLGQTLAHAAALCGASVTLISTVPLSISNPHLVQVIYVRSSSELQAATEAEFENCEVLVMAAAVSDFTVEISNHKLSRQDNQTLTLEKTADILRTLSLKKGERQTIGFCLTDQDLESTARKKLLDKQLNLIIANGPESFGKASRDVVFVTESQSKTYQNIPILELALQILATI